MRGFFNKFPHACGQCGMALCQRLGDGNVVFKRLQARLRGHRFKAAWLALPFRSFAALGEGQKSESTRRQTGGLRRIGGNTSHFCD
jgi:hypothetical protein